MYFLNCLWISGILGLILKRERERKKGCTETWWSRRENQHRLSITCCSFNVRNPPTDHKGREGGKDTAGIRRWFNSSVELRRQFLPLPASLIKYLTSESAPERTLRDLCCVSHQTAGTVLLGWWVYFSFFLYFEETKTMPQVCCVCVSACVCVGKMPSVFKWSVIVLKMWASAQCNPDPWASSRLLSQSRQGEALTVPLWRRRHQNDLKWRLGPL